MEHGKSDAQLLHGALNVPLYRFKKHDGGRATSRRPRQKTDCTVRALALAVGIPYDDAYNILADAGRKCSARFYFNQWVVDAIVAGKAFERETFPATAGQKRMNPVSFCSSHATGTYIIQTAKHVTAVIDGVLHDETPMPPDRCIYACWAVKDAA